MPNKPVKDTRKKADLKVVMVGDASVGKTCLVLRYTERQFQDSLSTIGASFVFKDWGTYSIAIWDTAGEEKYAGLTTFYYRNASAAILTFDMFDRHTYHNLNQRYIPILNNVSSAELKVIVGTKSDLLGTRIRQVTAEEGIALAKASNPNMDFSDGFIPYFETSSKTGKSVDEMFEYIFNFFYPGGKPKLKPLEDGDSIQLDKKVERNYGFRCC